MLSGLPMGMAWTYSASDSRSMSTESRKMLDRNMSTEASWMRTRSRRSPTGVTVTVMSLAASSKPLALAVSRATCSARSSLGIQMTAARAAASAARCIRLACVYQDPMSTAKPAKASRGSNSNADMTIT